ncbi:4-hydroxybenzoate 3-monooxygenase [Actinocorallia sp. A-T 12471]|uniref:4-hydroxybenzoate 3-monooxygenase n=1 Tax=Actinocorallia sp. A-T 12471 TaxID=3089813 RepID=UPI0029CB798E|nr:4-hydroxybenzoate 3-monooxygenase [Actinocorallia sp. A-T 12471]MDX6740394.1 4-hydroxybenzoate 3-monooxygenase [Actinocorallia sp. A-T 12471]
MNQSAPVPARTQVAIIGAGPAGLLLGHLLHRKGVDTVVLENRDRAYVERRQRAGILEQGTVDVLRATGAAAGMDARGLRHDGIELRFEGESHRIDFPALTGRSVMVYAQTEVVKDLIALRLAADAPLAFEAEALDISGIEGESPQITYKHCGVEHTLTAEYVVACDGFHGVGRRVMPEAGKRTFERVYPFSWLGVLADVAPSCDELIYAHSPEGFALHSMRSPKVSRLYLQVPPDTDLAEWSDDRIWNSLARRFAIDGDWKLETGPITEKGITPMRSFVTEPMRHGQLFLAGDAAHIVPPTGAKGLNLAAADVTLLAAALVRRYTSGDTSDLDTYSTRALRRIWRAEHFSYAMTSMLHTSPTDDAFDHRLQISQLRHLTESKSAATSLAENYTGLPLPTLTLLT